MAKWKVPFSLNKDDARTLVDQVADGLRSAIAEGFYRPGDAIPPSRELAPLLGVSRRVTKTAMERLAGEGFILSRPRLGSVVRDRAARRWRGNVLFVQRSDGRGYYVSVFTATLRARLARAGWLFTQVTAAPDRAGEPDLAELELHLTHPVSLAVSMFDNRPAERMLAKSGVPFVTLGNKPPRRTRNHVAHVHYDGADAAARLAEAAVRAGVKTALQVGIGSFDDTYAALKAGGMRVKRWNLPLTKGRKMPEAVAIAARDAIQKWLASAKGAKDGYAGKKALPDMIYFSDDYACAGALAAFAEAGVKVPGDVRIATWSNAGNTPIFAKELARTEMDPEGDAEKVADAILAHLEGRPAAFPATLGPVFREGATL